MTLLWLCEGSRRSNIQGGQILYNNPTPVRICPSEPGNLWVDVASTTYNSSSQQSPNFLGYSLYRLLLLNNTPNASSSSNYSMHESRCCMHDVAAPIYQTQRGRLRWGGPVARHQEQRSDGDGRQLGQSPHGDVVQLGLVHTLEPNG